MKQMITRFLALLCVLGPAIFALPSAGAEVVELFVHVRDTKDRPLEGVRLGSRGRGEIGTSDRDGKLIIALAETPRGTWITWSSKPERRRSGTSIRVLFSRPGICSTRSSSSRTSKPAAP